MTIDVRNKATIDAADAETAGKPTFSVVTVDGFAVVRDGRVIDASSNAMRDVVEAVLDGPVTFAALPFIERKTKGDITVISDIGEGQLTLRPGDVGFTYAALASLPSADVVTDARETKRAAKVGVPVT